MNISVFKHFSGIVTMACVLMMTAAMLRSSEAQDLNSALLSLLASSPTIQSARENLTSAQQNVEAAKKRHYPTVQIHLQAARVKRDNSKVRALDITGGVTKSLVTKKITAVQNLFNGFSDTSRIAEAEANLKRATAQHMAAVQSELERGIRAYFTLLQEKEIQASLEKSLSLVRNVQNLIKSNTNSEAGSKTNLIKAEKAVADAQARLAAQKHRVARASGNFVRYFGMPPQAETLVYREIRHDSLPVSLDVLLAQINNNHDVVANFMRAEAFSARARQAQSARYPTLDMTLSHERDNDSFVANATRDGIETSITRESRIELNLEWNLTSAVLNGNAENSALARAHSERAKAHALSRRIEGEAIQAWDDYQISSDEISSLESLIRHEDELLRLQESNLKPGGSTEQRITQQKLRRERVVQRYIRAVHGAEISKAKLLALMGSLSAEL